MGTQEDINSIISSQFDFQEMIKRVSSGSSTEGTYDDKFISRFAESIIQAGINARASDIHLDPRYPQMCLRFRIDGILHDVTNIPKSIEVSLVSRIKALAGMDITERKRPQNGYVSLRFDEKDYDFSVGCASTITGEKLLVRVLDKSGMLLDVDELGLSARNQAAFLSLIIKSSGVILITGPAASGKTATLYAALNKINNLGKNVVTIEDPVEYKLNGVNQTQVNPAADITFSTGLRSILRQDPDIIMVGEISDLETATTAMRAALSGHLVFSTLHTNDGASAIARLIDMGVEPFLVSSAIMGVVAQRLVRIICPKCKEQYEPTVDMLKELGLESYQAGTKFFHGKGCQYCMQTAYYGRTGVFEVMRISDRMRELILQKQPVALMREVAVKEGMFTLREAALEKIALGITTPEEMKRITFTTEG